MTQSRKTVPAVVSMTLVLAVGAILWMWSPKQEKVIELPPVMAGQR